jgi:hypothetical protein
MDTPGGTTFGELGIVRCNEGYVNKGDSLLKCQSNGTWSGTPQCTIISTFTCICFSLFGLRYRSFVLTI